MVGLVEAASTFDLSRRLTTGKLVGAHGYTAEKRDGGPFGQKSRSTWLTGQVWRLTIAFSSFAYVSLLRGSSFYPLSSRWRHQFHSPTFNRTSTPPLPFLGTSRPRSSPHTWFRCGPTICTRVAKCRATSLPLAHAEVTRCGVVQRGLSPSCLNFPPVGETLGAGAKSVNTLDVPPGSGGPSVGG